ncbi:DUF2318 domain-containing protein [Clostridium thermarum]|uniref:DUF2318 domain-containing protein n=1 Tax=Clostridium thermarum TaxID=1716543 RepID=UPI001FACC43D|nr:DUF2318 domain-containing protein [Clostridium thermarum]
MSKKNNVRNIEKRTLTKKNKKKADYRMVIISSVTGLIMVIAVIVALFSDKPVESNNTAKSQNQTVIEDVLTSGDLIIPKVEVTETAKFYPYKVDNVTMEVFAVKAKDGTIRTALNTCQICYASGRGYYLQEGDTFVCQNCGNVFDVDQIEKVRNGCNPVPVGEENKSDDGSNIVISENFMKEYKDLFLRWKK